jgi:hypothetical protein
MLVQSTQVTSSRAMPCCALLCRAVLQRPRPVLMRVGVAAVALMVVMVAGLDLGATGAL